MQNLTFEIVQQARERLRRNQKAEQVFGMAMSPRLYHMLRTTYQLREEWPVLIDPRLEERLPDKVEMFYEQDVWRERMREQNEFDSTKSVS